VRKLKKKQRTGRNKEENAGYGRVILISKRDPKNNLVATFLFALESLK
jgi:hypothetical protein